MLPKLLILKGKFAICRFNHNSSLPSWVNQGDFYSITKSKDEISVVCNQENVKGVKRVEKNWKVLKIEGPLDFSLIGIISKISTILAENNISIFVISTFDTFIIV